MRSAEEIFIEIATPIIGEIGSDELAELKSGDDDECKMFNVFIESVRTAQREAIRACAEKASVQFHNYDSNGNIINVRGMGYEVSLDGTPTTDYVSVDKQSILQLLNNIQ